jgi:hypothetical protein
MEDDRRRGRPRWPSPLLPSASAARRSFRCTPASASRARPRGVGPRLRRSRAPSPCAWSSSRTSRRACRIETRPSSAILWSTFTYSLRRSSLSGGMGTRITLPSFAGFRPRSAVWIARSMSPMSDLSKGCTTISARSGSVDGRDLVQRHLGAVGVHADRVQERRGRLAGTHRRELPANRVQGVFHALLGVFHGRHRVPPEAWVANAVAAASLTKLAFPTSRHGSRRRRRHAPEVEHDDGSWFSLQRETAAASITASSRLTTSWKEMLG